MKLSIVVPCYNEKENIPLLLKRFAEVIRDGIEVVIVDNGSDDGSGALLEEQARLYPFMRTVTVKENQGYGYGILHGLAACIGKYVGWTHADLQTDPADIVKAFKILEELNTPAYIKGERKGRPLPDRFFTYGMSLFESIYLGEILWDINAQPNIFPRAFYLEWKNPPYDFSLDLYAFYMAKKKGLIIKRFDVKFPERCCGESKWNTGLRAKCRFIKRTIDYSRKLKKGGIR